MNMKYIYKHTHIHTIFKLKVIDTVHWELKWWGTGNNLNLHSGTFVPYQHSVSMKWNRIQLCFKKTFIKFLLVGFKPKEMWYPWFSINVTKIGWFHVSKKQISMAVRQILKISEGKMINSFSLPARAFSKRNLAILFTVFCYNPSFTLQKWNFVQ